MSARGMIRAWCMVHQDRLSSKGAVRKAVRQTNCDDLDGPEDTPGRWMFLSFKESIYAMTTAALKKKIKALVDEKRDANALRRIQDLLIDPALEGDQKAALRVRLDKAEDDFAHGRVMNVDEVRSALKTSLESHRIEQAQR